MTSSDTQKRTCKEICKRYRVKKPTEGRGRYESGQARCQICDIWIDHNGCLLKDGSPATIGSAGWTCKCCNYRVRQKPRNLVYKEKLRNKTLYSDSIDEIEQTKKELEKLKAELKIKKAPIRKEELKKKRTQKYEELIINKIEISEVNPETINYLIRDALILIREGEGGILQSELKQIFHLLSENEFNKLIPRLLRIENICDEEVIRNGTVVDKILKTPISLTPCPSCKTTPKSYKQAVNRFGLRYNGTIRQSYCYKCRSSKARIKIEENDKPNKKSISKNVIIKSKIQYSQDSDDDIKILTEKMITEYFSDKLLIDKQLRKILTAEFVKIKSLLRMFEMHPELSEIEIIRHIITDQRLPSELKKLENEGALHSNVECALRIALFSTKYCNWDGEKDKENDVIILAKSISNYLKKDKELNRQFEGRRN